MDFVFAWYKGAELAGGHTPAHGEMCRVAYIGSEKADDRTVLAEGGRADSWIHCRHAETRRATDTHKHTPIQSQAHILSSPLETS